MSDLVISRDRLGGGAQGMVFKGTWKGMQVAVKKCLQPDPRDVRILLSLGGHPNVIRLYGMVKEEYSCLVVTELVKGGSLYDFLYKEKKTPSDDQRLYWMKDIAMGMEFLHHQGIAHRDLKSGNVLLGDRMMAKLCDFGTARSLDHTTCQSAVTGTYRWMAPEIVDSPDARINKKCDMYSYAMVLYELVTLKKPFYHAPTGQKAMVNAVMGKRPVLPESDAECPPFLRCLITACWDADPKVRPSFEVINLALDSKTFPVNDTAVLTARALLMKCHTSIF